LKRCRMIRWIWGGLFSLIVLSSSIPIIWAGEPANSIKEGTDRILDVLRDSKWKDKSKATERRKVLRKIADDYFDWEEMAKRSLALHWAERTPEEKKEFVSLFSDLLERSYIGKIEGYKDEKIPVVGEKVDGEYAVVETKIITQREVEVPINYKLRKKPSGWLIYDVSIDGVSLVNNYRTQFNKILSSSSYPELVRRMKLKQFQESTTSKPSD